MLFYRNKYLIGHINHFYDDEFAEVIYGGEISSIYIPNYYQVVCPD